MPYIAAFNLADNILGYEVDKKKQSEAPKPTKHPSIRERYIDKAKVEPGTPLKFYQSTYTGARDPKRGQQIERIENFAGLTIKASHKLSPADATQLNLIKYKMLVGILYMTQKEIEKGYWTYRKTYGDLHASISKELNVNGTLDDATKIECLKTLIKANEDNINKFLPKQLNATEWDKIKNDARNHVTRLETRKTQGGPAEKVLSTTMKVVARPLGYGTGFVFGSILGRSTLMNPLFWLLDKMFRGVFYVTNRRDGGDHGRMASMFFARSYAEDATTYSCGIAAAMILGNVLDKTGATVGRHAGRGLDFVGGKTVDAARHLYGLFADPKNRPVRMGIDLISGQPVFYNEENELVEISELSQMLKERKGQPAEELPPEKELEIQAFIRRMETNPVAFTEVEEEEDEEEQEEDRTYRVK